MATREGGCQKASYSYYFNSIRFQMYHPLGPFTVLVDRVTLCCSDTFDPSASIYTNEAWFRYRKGNKCIRDHQLTQALHSIRLIVCST